MIKERISDLFSNWRDLVDGFKYSLVLSTLLENKQKELSLKKSLIDWRCQNNVLTVWKQNGIVILIWLNQLFSIKMLLSPYILFL